MRSTGVMRTAVAMLAVLPCISCQTREVTVHFYLAEGYSFTNAERRAIRDIADATAREVRQHLPTLSHELIVRVQAQTSSEVIPETGETGSASPPHAVYWRVDPTRPGGVIGVVETWLHASLVHEFHHLVSAIATPRSVMDRVIMEGMATAFERDITGMRIPWAHYPDDVGAWVEELIPLTNVEQEEWMDRHSDATRWLDFKLGTYLVDQAIEASGASWSTLTAMSADEVLALGMGK